MRVTAASIYLLSTTLSITHANTHTSITSRFTSDASPWVVAYWSPITTLPPEPLPTPVEHLELRAAPAAAPVAPVAAAPAPNAPAAAAPVAPVAPAAAAPAAAAVPAAPAPAAPGVGVGGAAGQPPAAQPAATNPAQVPPVTTYQANTVINGVAKQVPVIYTQLFSSVPSQGPTPRTDGSIGLGTLTGTIGVVRSGEAKKGDASNVESVGVGSVVISVVFTALGAVFMWI